MLLPSVGSWTYPGHPISWEEGLHRPAFDPGFGRRSSHAEDAAIGDNNHSPQFSLAKDKIRVLLLEGVNDSAVALIEAAGYPA